MKIAMVGGRGVPALYGGFETATQEIGARLAERGHEVTVYCRRGYGDASGETYRGMKKVYVPCVHRPALETLSHTLLALAHVCIHPPDVLIVMNPANGPLALIPRLRGVPFAMHVDGLDWERAKWPALGRKYIYFGAWCCTRIAPELIADSRAIQAFYKERWNRDAHYASYGAVPVQSTRPEVLDEYGLKPDGYFVVVARLEPENNADLMIEAFLKLRTDRELIIVGRAKSGTPYIRRLNTLAESGRVRFLGAIYDRDHLNEVLCNAFAYIHGHSVGGTNPALLEAMGCGACVAYLDVPFNAEVVGDAGVPFPSEVSGAAQVLQDLVDHPEKARQLRSRARGRVMEAYTWERATDDYETLCQELLERHGRGSHQNEVT